MKPFEHNGRQFTNADAWRTAKATVAPKPPAAELDEEKGYEEAEMQPHHEQIHEHLRNMNQMTGEAHSHIEHHEDGSHTSHHVSKDGEMHGPHDHANIEKLKSNMDKFLEEEGREGEGNEEEENYR